MIARTVRRTPFTIALLIVLLSVAIATGPIRGPSPLLRRAVGIDLSALSHREWWSFLTADFFVDSLAQLVIVLLVCAVGLGTAERLMGTWRTIGAFVITGVVGSAVGLGVQALGVLTGEYWAEAVRSLVTIDPLTPIIGTVAVASAFATVLWRRRIRTISVAATVVLLLFSGQPSDLYRLVAVLVGLGIGVLLTRSHTRPTRWTSSHHEARVLLATVTAIFAVGPLATLVSRGKFGLLSPLGAFVTHGMPQSRTGGVACAIGGVGHTCAMALGHHAGQTASAVVLGVIPLVILFVAARGLLNGRRAAVYLVAAFALADGVLAGFYFGIVPVIGNASGIVQRAGQSPEFGLWMLANSVLPIALAVAVLAQVRHFPIRAAVRARTRYVVWIGLSAAVASVVYLGLGWLLRAQFRPTVGFFDLLSDLPERFIPVSFLLAERKDFVPTTLATRLLYHGIGPLFWVSLLVATVVFLRGARSLGREPAEITQLRALLRDSGGSMSFPATWAGNRYWFDSDGRLAVAYRVANGCAVTVSDPVGRPRDVRESLGQFIRFCDDNAWTPVFYSVHDEWAAPLRELGWSTTVVAEETLIDPSTWEMTGKKWQDVRSSVNRAAREGVTVTWGTWSSLSVRVTNQIAEISELWVVEKKLPELGFTLGGLDELSDPDVLLGVAIDATGGVQAVTSWMPTWADGTLTGYTLDFMRRRADGMNGVMEFLIAEAAVRAKLGGLEFLSLSGAPLAVTAGDGPESAVDRVLAAVGKALEPVYGFRSLLTFKQKFQPRLVPLVMAYPDALSLPAIAVALSRCYLPGLTLRESAGVLRGIR
ncbi:MAG: DUF2156 domain-containing protein [Rhodoglobus sp.]